MFELIHPTFDACLVSFITCAFLREMFILILPDQLAGPGGSFVDTDRRR